MIQTNNEREVVVKLKDWQIPHLLGAIRLGLTLEDWCAESMFIEMGIADSMSPHWQSVVVGAKLEIIKQTGIQNESFAYAQDKTLGTLWEVLFKEFKKWEKKRLDWEAREDEKNARR